MTAASLKEYTAKDLAQMAKRRGVTGWHAMRKDELVKALIKAAKTTSSATKSKPKAKKTKPAAPAAKATVPAARKSRKAASSKPKPAEVTATKKRTPKPKPEKKSDPKIVESIRNMHEQRQAAKDIGTSGSEPNGADRLVLMVRDSYWLHACWEVSRKSIDRAKAALAQDWHTSVPVLRVTQVDGEIMTSGSERLVKQIEIHGGVKNWYIDVADPPKSYRCHLGYLATNGRFHAIARSNVVTTPRPGSCEEIDGNWDDVAENVEKIYALSGGSDEEHADGELREMLEQRFRRPVGMPMAARLGLVGDQFTNGKSNQDFDLKIDVEMIVYGSTKPGSYVTLSGEPVKVREDGTFLVKMDFPDKRQIFPIVARSKDGLEQRTIALAVERNTKTMDPISHDPRESNNS
ncbi:DUF4912 domain-containing protein [Blastopirellula marina]|uniref:DUF4912 domain-containing protein n=1 Tax=Blastopirellula marina TaxID=124 RepID=A0A2S8GEI4_9BACT|nr:DUF4912 domain-containing protein [Blastopirellula marina]PTL46634.1 DUF4912 domain-containing protein [Blastopirellula marina]